MDGGQEAKTMTRGDFLRQLARRPQRERALDRERLAALAVPEEERMMGWMSLRRQLVKALGGDVGRLERYVALTARHELGLDELAGALAAGEGLSQALDERPPLRVVSQQHLGPGTALYTVRELKPTVLSEILFGAEAIEADIQVTSGSDWLLRALRPV